MNNKYGIFSWFGFVMPLHKRLELIKNAGFDAVTIWWEDEQGNPKIKKEEMPKLVRNAGLVLENIHVPYNNSNDFWSESDIQRNKLVEKHIEWLYECASFDIPMMVIHVSEGENPPGPNLRGIKAIEKLVDIAEELNIKIAVENTRDLVHIPVILNEIKSDVLGFCFDSSHAHLKGIISGLLTNFSDRLFATHISDNDGIHDRHWLPKNGEIDWGKIKRLFPQNYSGFLTLEVYPTKQEQKNGPKEFIRKAYKRALNL